MSSDQYDLLLKFTRFIKDNDLINAPTSTILELFEEETCDELESASEVEAILARQW